MAVYVNPLAHAGISAAERIDQGVDYAVTGGYLAAIGRCQIVANAPGGWAPYGNFVAYKLLDPGPLEGAQVYYAEGVTSGRRVGDYLDPGNGVCNLIPYWHSGIEIGWYSGVPYSSWANEYGGGYSEGDCTRAGLSFNDLLIKLGAPGGRIEGPIVGNAPPYSLSGIVPGRGSGGPPPRFTQSALPTILQFEVGRAIRQAGDAWSVHGNRTYTHAQQIKGLFDGVRYVTTDGPR